LISHAPSPFHYRPPARRARRDNDTLYGDEGNVTLAGGLGDDSLTGGAGADTFVFTANTGSDTITDGSVQVVQLVCQALQAGYSRERFPLVDKPVYALDLPELRAHLRRQH